MENNHEATFGLGEPNVNFAKYFIGNSYLNPLAKVEEANLSLFNVTFEPRCRNNWHIHHATSGGGQILICVDGEGWYQEEGKEAVSLKSGTIITISANYKAFEVLKDEIHYNKEDNNSIGKMYLKLKERCRISDTEIAKLIGMPRTTMNEKLKKIGLKC